nr:ATP-grasp domain-containing protein [Candidatus Njordarchaeum guaymaensis]
MEKIGILVISYGSRDVAIIDALSRSKEYSMEFYIVDKQRNPFNLGTVDKLGKHIVIPDLSIVEICSFAERYRDKIDFGIVGSETPIIQGIRDLLEERTGIPLACPTRKYAIEASKVAQRILLQECWPKANPTFKVFDPKEIGDNPKTEFKDWLSELEGPERVVIKPDRPGFGKGVGVGGEHFKTAEEAYAHFKSIYEAGGGEKVIIEEKIDGEESSFQALCDGKHLAVLPETRDYKRAYEGDEGPNTGGMGSYKGEGELLPFMEPSDREEEIKIVERVFRELAGNGNNPNLRGLPFYVAFMHSDEGPKILEINSRPGDPEIQNILPIIDQDFIEVCLNIIDGKLHSVRIKPLSSVVIYKVPPSYGNYFRQFPDKVSRDAVDSPIHLDKALKFVEENPENLRLYPGSIEVRPDGKSYSLSSRTICSVGIGETIEEARGFSLEAINKVLGGSLWYRSDIASQEHINKSIEHMKQLKVK